MAANPALICTNSKVVQKALRKLDFLVVADILMTPTSELADIVLPACTFLEQIRTVIYDIHADHGWNATKARATPSIDPRVVHLYYGFKESNCNILTDHKTFDPITGSVGMKSLLCNIKKI